MTIVTRAGDLDRRLLMDRSVSGRRAFSLPESDVPAQELLPVEAQSFWPAFAIP